MGCQSGKAWGRLNVSPAQRRKIEIGRSPSSGDKSKTCAGLGGPNGSVSRMAATSESSTCRCSILNCLPTFVQCCPLACQSPYRNNTHLQILHFNLAPARTRRLRGNVSDRKGAECCPAPAPLRFWVATCTPVPDQAGRRADAAHCPACEADALFPARPLSQIQLSRLHHPPRWGDAGI